MVEDCGWQMGGDMAAGATSGRPLWAGAKVLASMLAAAGAGMAVASLLHVHRIFDSSGYLYAVTTVLAIGIYGATSGIQGSELRRHRGTIAVALTVGVVAKAVLISIVMIVVLRQPLYAILLGVAVAQIDPVSVAAMITKSRMSESAKAILLAWSSFDDPVTMLLTVYLLAFAARPGGTGGLSHVAGTTSPIGLVLTLAANIAFAVVVWLLHRLVRRLGRRSSAWLEIVLLLAAGVVAVLNFYLLGLAIVGLFLRPDVTRQLGWIMRLSLVAATFALGLVLSDGVEWGVGIALGVAAYLAQVAVAPVVARGHAFADRMYLALGQQNGITAITLALLLQAVFPGTVGIVAPAVLVVNVLNVTVDAAWDRRVARGVPESFAMLLRGPSAQRALAKSGSTPVSARPSPASEPWPAPGR